MLARLDAIDRKILAELQEDGRMTNVELARRVGLSAPPCLRRVRRLEVSRLLTWSVTMRVPTCSACFCICSMSQGPWITSAKPG